MCLLLDTKYSESILEDSIITSDKKGISQYYLAVKCQINIKINYAFLKPEGLYN